MFRTGIFVNAANLIYGTVRRSLQRSIPVHDDFSDILTVSVKLYYSNMRILLSIVT